MKFNKFAYLHSKPLGNHTLKIMEKIPGNLLKKTWKNHGNIMEFCQSEKVGTLCMASPPYLMKSLVEFPITQEDGSWLTALYFLISELPLTCDCCRFVCHSSAFQLSCLVYCVCSLINFNGESIGSCQVCRQPYTL